MPQCLNGPTEMVLKAYKAFCLGLQILLLLPEEVLDMQQCPGPASQKVAAVPGPGGSQNIEK